MQKSHPYLITFHNVTVQLVLVNLAITGVAPQERKIFCDIWPANGKLYDLSFLLKLLY